MGMVTALFVWVGSGRARRRKVGPQGARLDRAAYAGLPVPPGAILLDEFLRVCLREGLAEWGEGRVFIPDPELLHNTLIHSVRLPRFDRPVTLSGLSSPDAAHRGAAEAQSLSRAIDLNDAGQTAAALAALWSAALRQPAARGDVLALERVDALWAGRARTSPIEPEDLVEIDEPAASVHALPQLRGFRTADVDRPPHARRLQMLLGGVRRTFGRGDWSIKWADDGRICWLLEVTPLAGA
jgi:pyruvate,water dikinase